MSSLGACLAADMFATALKEGKGIPWEEVVALEGVVGGEIRLRDRDIWCQGIISSIVLENGVVSIMCPWVLKTPMDEDGDPTGDYMPEEWEVMKNPKLPLSIQVPKAPLPNRGEELIHTSQGSFASGNWVIRHSESVLGFWAGGATIYLKSFSFHHTPSVRALAPRFGLLIPE